MRRASLVAPLLLIGLGLLPTLQFDSIGTPDAPPLSGLGALPPVALAGLEDRDVGTAVADVLGDDVEEAADQAAAQHRMVS